MPRITGAVLVIAALVVGGCNRLEEKAYMRECMAQMRSESEAGTNPFTETEQREACQCGLDKTRHINIETATPEELNEILDAGIECGQDVIRKKQR